MSMFSEKMSIFKRETEEFLNSCIPTNPVEEEQQILFDAMNYSLSDGGKRIRPVLTLAFCEACGGDYRDALSFAGAIEMIHSYSLVHDDLPCMDDDDMRRGKPSCHKKFGEANALLAGDALFTLAFETALNENTNIPSERVIKAAKVLAYYAGACGMVGGQIIDLMSETKHNGLEKLKNMDALKTGALIKAASEMGCIVAGANEEQLNAAKTFSESIGLAFQIQDDILDVTSSSEELGKPVGSDVENEKSTYVALLGLEESAKLVNELTLEAQNALNVFGEKGEFLKELALVLSNRRK